MSAEQTQPEFVIQKVYTQDISFEAPGTPASFHGEWKPEANIDLNTDSEKLDDNNHHVTLSMTVTVKNGKDTAFLVEVKQSGVFTVSGFEEAQMGPLLGSYCPSTLFPYAREAISCLVSKGGFPELNLAPINFDALYAQQQQAPANDTKK